MTLSRRYARVLGAMALIVAFGAGVVAGRLYPPASPGMRMTVTATDAIPVELERLALSDSQRAQLHLVLRRGRDRVLRVVDRFDPSMRAAVDTTDNEIRALLTASQRAAFDSARRLNPPFRQRIIRPRGDGDTTTRADSAGTRPRFPF